MYKFSPMKAKTPWNKGKVVGPKKPLTVEQTRLIRMLLVESGDLRDLVLFCVGIDTAFRGVDLVRLKVSDVMNHGELLEFIRIVQKKTDKKVTGRISPQTQEYLKRYIQETGKNWNDYLFTRKKGKIEGHISEHQYRDILKRWLRQAGINPSLYGTHSLRRTKTTLIYEKTGNLRACQKLLGHSSIQNTASYLGIEESEALEISKNFDF